MQGLHSFQFLSIDLFGILHALPAWYYLDVIDTKRRYLCFDSSFLVQQRALSN
jgi:hypothetical protein